MSKILIPIQGDFIAPRFDLATEILIARCQEGQLQGEPRTIIMERPSDEGLCQMIVEENITDLLCGGIEELHYNFLTWKKVHILDALIGDWHTALQLFLEGALQPGAVLPTAEESSYTL